MKKFTKISAVALFSVFLAACDKPATSAANKVEEVKTTVAAVNVDEQNIADFNKLQEWKLSQEASLNQAQNELQQSIATKDNQKIEMSFNALKMKVDEVVKSLDALDIKSEEIKAFQMKTKESLVLSNELIELGIKASANPTPEVQKMVQEKADTLIKLGEQLQQTQAELQKKYSKQQ